MRATLNIIRQGLAAAMLVVASAGASAAVVKVAGADPEISVATGIQSDGLAPNLTTPVSLFSGKVVSVDWWGYDTLAQPQGGASTDSFEVLLGGVLLSGGVDRSQVSTVHDDQTNKDFALFKYTLTVTNQMMFSNPDLLDITNYSDDVNWLWQGNTVAMGRAYAIFVDQPDGQLPEPTALALASIALLAAASQRRRRAAH